MSKDVTKDLLTPGEEQQDLLASDLGSARNLLTGINDIVQAITNEVSQKQVELATKNYLGTDTTKEYVTTYLNTELSGQLQQAITAIIDKELVRSQLDDVIKQELTATFEEVLKEYLQTIAVPVINIVQLDDVELGRTEGNFFHEKFEEILSLVQLEEPIMLIGPAGGGKNHAVLQVANALGLKMYYTNNASNEFKLTGFIDAGGKYQETQFYKAYKNGGLFMLDEIDNSDPSSLIVINSALANGYMAFPHETIKGHPDFRIVAAANTWGKGSDLQYVGRNVLDGATLDRFDNIFFNYDQQLERALYPNEEVLAFMWALRDAVSSIRLSHIISTRGIGKVYKKVINGIPIDTILRTNVIKNLRQDDVNLLIGNMQDTLDASNRFFIALKAIEVGR